MKKNNFLLGLILSGISIHLINNQLFNAAHNKLNHLNKDEQVYHWKFGDISYQKIGQGKPVLLIHDTFSGASSYEYTEVIHQLAKKNTVYAIDLLGYGYSEKSTITYTAYLYIQLVNDFIREVIGQRHINVITSGHSNIFALFAAYQESETIRKIIMINPGDLKFTSMNPTKRDHTLKYLLELPYIGTTIYNILHLKPNYYNQFQLHENNDKMKLHLSRFYNTAHYENSQIRFVFASYISNYLNMNIKNILKKLNVSLYIINGESRSIGSSFIEKQYSDINPSIECATVKKSGSLPHLENPYTTFDLIDLFINH